MNNAQYYRSKAEKINSTTLSNTLDGIMQRVEQASSEGKFYCCIVQPLGVSSTLTDNVISALKRGGFTVEVNRAIDQRSQASLIVRW